MGVGGGEDQSFQFLTAAPGLGHAPALNTPQELETKTQTGM